MNCNQCNKDFTPKQKYCCVACRVKHHRNDNDSATADKAVVLHPSEVNVTKMLQNDMATLQEIADQRIEDNESVTKTDNEAVTDTKSLPVRPPAQVITEKKVGKKEAKTPFDLCKKHGGMYRTCHC